MRISWLIPREKKFFDLLEKEATNILRGAQRIYELMNNNNYNHDIERAKEEITEIEHETDDIVHTIFEELNVTFITPIDREDISALASALDNILDHIHGAVRRMYLYGIEEPTPAMRDFARVLLRASEELNLAVRSLRELEKPERIEERCIKVNSLENEADEILNYGVTELFKKDDVKEIIKLKEIYEFLESAVDRCEDAANVISDIVVKNR
ncbi:MAG: DUF47 domain-containing protein [Candidatus Methanospirareceae archaeon]